MQHQSLLSLAAPDDYTGQVESLTFSSSVAELSVLVPIEDDNLDEEDFEKFIAILITVNQRVTLAPGMADVFIQDDDGNFSSYTSWHLLLYLYCR